jgi:hypothetical protein
MLEISLESLFSAGADAAPLRACRRGRRIRVSGAGMDRILDYFPQQLTSCCMLRITSPGRVRVVAEHCQELAIVSGGGWTLRTTAAHYWIPARPRLHTTETMGRIRSDSSAPIVGMSQSSDCWSLVLEVAAGSVMDFTLYRIPSELADDLMVLESLEVQGLFLWGSHTVFSRPADLHRHLVHGLIYEDRYEWPKRWRICSENDAHALFVCCSGLSRATNKPLYEVLKAQILLSVLARQDPDGGFRHGTWTDGLESHYRLHTSAMHLFMDALEESPDPAISDALETALSYAAAQVDETALGRWFLHDELEKTEEGMNQGPFRWIPSQILDKSPSNMLVLNTHLDTLVALIRHMTSTGNEKYRELIESARHAALGILALRPAEWLYRAVFRLIDLTMLPTEQAAALPVTTRALKRIAWMFVIPRLPALKTRIPRLVMPGGYVDRALSLENWGQRYLGINAMDLARVARQLPHDREFLTISADAVRYAFNSGVFEKWRENVDDHYALVFLAEALCHLCSLDESNEWRDKLVAVLFVLHDLALGFPPSALGTNWEFGGNGRAPLPPRCADPNLRFVLVSSSSNHEMLILNTAHCSLPTNFTGDGLDAYVWTDPEDNDFSLLKAIPPRSWIRGRPR